MINKTIGVNLKRLRQEKGLTLDQVATLSGVSKSMIGQIERGDSAPTVTTLWKISNGLKISFSALMDQQMDETYVVSRESLSPLDETDHSFQVLTYIPFDVKRRFETFLVECIPGAVHRSDPHHEAHEEFVFVTEGTLEVEVGQEVWSLKQDDMMRFNAGEAHVYRNEGENTAKALVLIVYP